MRMLAFALLFSLPGFTVAQAVPCHANLDNPTFNDATSMGGPNLLLGMKTTAPAAFVATSIEVFTGEQTGVNTVSIWSHDASNNRPLAQLAIGTWSMSRVNTWQGAALTTPLPVAAGQDFWVVWAPINGAQSSLQASGTNVTYRGSFDGGTSWNGPFNGPWKFRIWCTAAAEMSAYGTACPGTGFRRPEMAWFGTPQVGTTLNAHLERGQASGAAVLVLGDSDTVFSGGTLPYSLATLGAPGCNLLCSSLATVFTPIDPSGQAVLPIPIPNRGQLIGLTFFDQWLVLDTINPLGLITSTAARGVIGA